MITRSYKLPRLLDSRQRKRLVKYGVYLWDISVCIPWVSIDGLCVLQSTDHLVLQYRSTYFKGWISGVAYNASLPILFLSYVQNQFFPNNSENWALHYGILVAITVVLTFVNYRGLEVVGSVSVLIFFLTMAPFVLLVIIGIPKGKNVMMNWYADNIIHSPRIK